MMVRLLLILMLVTSLTGCKIGSGSDGLSGSSNSNSDGLSGSSNFGAQSSETLGNGFTSNPDPGSPDAPAPIPEPSTAILIGIALSGLAASKLRGKVKKC